MHMGDALISAPVGTVMCAVSAVAVGYSAKRVAKDEMSEKKVPIMAVSGAFIFAAQMINFTIPGTGSSGHIGGGIMLAALLGEYPALLAISAVLIIQCLFFADGGLLALGCNIFNMGVIPCLVAYPLLFKPFAKKGLNVTVITVASVIAIVLGLQMGAFAVVLETQFSGISQLPFGAFALLMQPIHLAIGVVEGIITAAVLCYVHKTRPEILESAEKRANKKIPLRNLVITFAVLAATIGGGLSLFASAYPDGLEWATEKTAGTSELEATGGVFDTAANIQESVAVLPDYGFKNNDSPIGTSVSGLVGGALVFILAGGTAFAITAAKAKFKT